MYLQGIRTRQTKLFKKNSFSAIRSELNNYFLEFYFSIQHLSLWKSTIPTVHTAVWLQAYHLRLRFINGKCLSKNLPQNLQKVRTGSGKKQFFFSHIEFRIKGENRTCVRVRATISRLELMSRSVAARRQIAFSHSCTPGWTLRYKFRYSVAVLRIRTHLIQIRI